MAIAYIQGEMLKNDLVRFDDLSINTDSLYVDVGSDRIGINNNAPAVALDVVGDTLITGTLDTTVEYLFTERAAHDFTPAATRGILWVRSDAPNVLVFTDDAGTDWDLNVATGGGNVFNSGTPLDNQLAVWTNATTIEGDADLTWDGSTLTVTGLLQTNASATGSAGINIPEGVAPTVPNDGDIWVTAAGEYFVRLNGVSVNLATAVAALNDLTDVTLTAAAENEILVKSATDWINNTYSEAGISRMTVATSAPVSPTPIEGDFWIDNTTITEFKIAVYTNSVWEEIVNKNELDRANGDYGLNGGNF